MLFTRLLESVKRWQIYTILCLIFLIYVILVRHSYQSIDRELTDSTMSRRLSIAQLAGATLSEKFERLVDIGISLSTRVQFRRFIAAGDWDKAGKILARVPVDFQKFMKTVSDAGFYRMFINKSPSRNWSQNE